MGAVAAALILVVAGMALVRVGWGGPTKAAGAGWAAALCGLLWLTVRDGAWGLAVGTVAAMAAALGIVLYAGATSPAKVGRPPREAPAVLLPHHRKDVARRFAVFVLTVPVAFAAAQWLAFGAQALARRGGAGAADATALTLMLQPVAWGLLMTWQMTRSGPARMIAPPLGAALLGTLLWSVA